MINEEPVREWADTTSGPNYLWSNTSGPSPVWSETTSGSSPVWANTSRQSPVWSETTSGLSPVCSWTTSPAWADTNGPASASTFTDLQTVQLGGEDDFLHQGAASDMAEHSSEWADIFSYPGYQELPAWDQEQVRCYQLTPTQP